MQHARYQPGDHISVSACTGADLVTLRWGKESPKPGLHPLATPSGRILSGWEPSDHRWHRGLWFAIKIIDNDNFWEEVAPFGRQEVCGQPALHVEEDGAWRIEMRLVWRRPSGVIAIEELRTIRCHGDATANRIDWHSQLRASANLHLDRTPFTTWGGYGGLGFRATRELHQVRFIAPDGERHLVTGDSLPWLACDGLLDGPSPAGGTAAGGILIIPDSSHPRHPTPFYAKSKDGFTFMNPAFLFHQGLDLRLGEQLDLRYRIVTVDGRWSENLASEVAAYGGCK